MRTPLVLALLLTSTLAGAAEQTRSLPAFDSVSIQGPVHMVVEVGAGQSLRIQGDDKYLAKVETKVVGGKLFISFPKNKRNELKMSGEDKILIGVPALRAFHVEGKVKSLKLNAQGVGDVDTRALQTQRADVTFEGIGAVKVHASERLDAVVQGMGSLNYYGNPRVINKTVEGIGSVTAGR